MITLIVGYWPVVLLLLIGFIILIGFRIIRPIEQGVIERFGKYSRTVNQGLRWLIPFVDRIIKVNITEIRLDVPSQMVITNDNLNLEIDAVVYFKVKDVLKSIYSVNEYWTSIPSLAQTTLRSIIGEMNFTEVNAQRSTINQKIELELDSQTEDWGIDILRVELQDVKPSSEVQRAMDTVVTAEREKEARITTAIAEKEASRQIAEATVIQSEADRKSKIIIAEGNAEAVRLAADAKAKAVKMVNDAVEVSFLDNSQKFKALEVTENSLAHNSKIILTEKGISPAIIYNNSDDKVIPYNRK